MKCGISRFNPRKEKQMSKKHKTEKNIVHRPVPDMSEINKLLEEVTVKAKKMQTERVMLELKLSALTSSNEMLRAYSRELVELCAQQRSTISELTDKNKKLKDRAENSFKDYFKAEKQCLDHDVARFMWKSIALFLILTHVGIVAGRLIQLYMKG